MKLNSTVLLTLILLTLMLGAGSVSAFWGFALGSAALKGVTTPDARPTTKFARKGTSSSQDKEGVVLIKEEEILFMHEKKTAALLEAAALFGAIIGSSTQEEKKLIDSFAIALGVGYQFTDDVLDQTGKFSSLGKPIGSDEKNAKATSICMYGLAKAQEKAFFWYDEALESLNKIEKNTDALKDLTCRLIKRNF